MTPFEQAAAMAVEAAPPPADRPLAAALTAGGFGVAVVGLFLGLRWAGLAEGACWAAAAGVYAVYAWADCALAWRRHRRAYRAALDELKAERGFGFAQDGRPSIH